MWLACRLCDGVGHLSSDTLSLFHAAQGLHDLRLSPPPDEGRGAADSAGDGGRPAAAAGSNPSADGAAAAAAPAPAGAGVRVASAAAPTVTPAGTPKKDSSDQMERLSKVRIDTRIG